MHKLIQPEQYALSIGTVMIDIITVIANNDIELMTLHNLTSSYLMLEQGRKIESQSIDTYVGGGAANTAVCMSRLGMKMDILALVGKDLNAEKILSRLKEENIALDHMNVVQDVGSGVAVHISSHDRNAAIFTHRGANCNLTEDHVKAIDFTKYKLVYITNLSNQSADHFPLIVKRAAKAHCFIASNPGIRQLTRLCDDFIQSLKSITLLSVNKIECESLIPHLVTYHKKSKLILPESSKENLPPLLATGFKFGGFSMGLVDCMKALSNYGPRNVVITDGSKGAYLLQDNILYYCPPQKVEMRGSAGAGDSFSSTLSCLISAGNKPDVALYAASLNAVSVISFVDTQTGLLTFEALKDAFGTVDPAHQIMRWNIQ
ncbi:MAG: carbohydrate kinase family protein [Emcibacter sp.]|nr:carbohydrate kinase family protein [Emcibacter sp.]